VDVWIAQNFHCTRERLRLSKAMAESNIHIRLKLRAIQLLSNLLKTIKGKKYVMGISGTK
jgi:hypothetical protein